MRLGLRVLILNTDYGEFLTWFYGERPELRCAAYAEQLKARMTSLFGVADFYSSNLRRLGHEAWDVHANNEFMQKAWARENGLTLQDADSDKIRVPALRRWTNAVLRRTPIRHLKRFWRPL